MRNPVDLDSYQDESCELVKLTGAREEAAAGMADGTREANETAGGAVNRR